MTMNMQGRPTRAAASEGGAAATFTGNRALQIEESLIFEKDAFGRTGIDLPALALPSRLGAHARASAIGLPGLSEPETMRHFVRLSQKN
ncbi:MAG: aminomethyl-transferring glycine dehydrogenase subunit GcvPB, partial [Parvularculaceae bacterium]|nr:aminomethyl-transferring glycine dehydrogenase subunit GcvPB [Parvularculaceae bacterium]